MSFFSGSFMLVSGFGNIGICFSFTSENLLVSFPIMTNPFVSGGRTHFLTSHHHLLHYGMLSYLQRIKEWVFLFEVLLASVKFTYEIPF